MADQKAKRRQPRIRKTAPTVRELAEAQQTKPEAKQAKRSQLGRVIRAIFKPLGFVLKPLKRVLLWLAPRYFINSWREVRQVTWPSRRETWRLTLAVFIFAAVFGTVVYFVDKGLDEIFKKVVLK